MSDSSKILRLPIAQKLIDALLKCQTVNDSASRNSIVQRLEFGDRITRHQMARIDVLHILAASIEYDRGFEKLIEIIELYEGDTIPVHDVITLSAQLQEYLPKPDFNIIKRSLSQSDNNTSIVAIVNHFIKHNSGRTDESRLYDQLVSYLKWMVDRYGTLKLRGFEDENAQSFFFADLNEENYRLSLPLNLDSIYIPLQSARPLRRLPPDSMAQILEHGRKIVLTGKVGSGKTTALCYIAWILSRAIINDDPMIAKEKLGLRIYDPASMIDAPRLPLPIFIPLTTYAEYLDASGRTASLKTVPELISNYLIENHADFGLAKDFFEKLLYTGEAIILLLDGLDEVVDKTIRATICEQIDILANGRSQFRIIVTCRTATYRSIMGRFTGFEWVEIKDLDKEQLSIMVRQVNQVIDPEHVQLHTEQLTSFIEQLDQQAWKLYKETLFTSPLWVRMLLAVHYGGYTLPAQRVALYGKMTDALIWPEYNISMKTLIELERALGVNWQERRNLLQELAYVLATSNNKSENEVTEAFIRRTVAKNSEFVHLAEHISFFQYDDRSPFNRKYRDIYGFVHPVFKEYLLARYLAEEIHKKEQLEKIVSELEKIYIQDEQWQEPILLMIGYLSIVSLDRARELLRRLINLETIVWERQPKMNAEVRHRSVEIALMASYEWPQLNNFPNKRELVEWLLTCPLVSAERLAAVKETLTNIGVYP